MAHKINEIRLVTSYYMHGISAMTKSSSFKWIFFLEMCVKKPHTWIKLASTEIHLDDECFLGNGFQKQDFPKY